MKLLFMLSLLRFIYCIQIPKTVDHDSTLNRLEIDNYPFHIKKVGLSSKTPIIVIHGGPGGDYRYMLPLEELQNEFQILFYDQRMTGLSSRNTKEKMGIEQDIEDLHKIVLNFSENKKPILIGHSYGAMIATGYLSKYPDSVSKAILIEPGILNKETAKEFVTRLKDGSSFVSSLKIIPFLFKSIFVKTMDGHEKFDYVMTNMLGSGKGKPYQCEGVSLPENLFQRGGFEVFNQTMRPLINNPNLFPMDLTVGLKNYTGPILLLSSSCSFIGFDYQETFHRKYYPENTKHIRLENTGHNFLNTDKEKGIEAIRNFLTQTR